MRFLPESGESLYPDYPPALPRLCLCARCLSPSLCVALTLCRYGAPPPSLCVAVLVAVVIVTGLVPVIDAAPGLCILVLLPPSPLYRGDLDNLTRNGEVAGQWDYRQNWRIFTGNRDNSGNVA